MIKLKRFLAVTLAALFLFPFPVSAGQPSVSAHAAILIAADTGRVLYAKNENEQLSMASTTKIMTALLTLEQENLDEYFTVDDKAIQVEGSSMGLQSGDQVSLRALAYGMLLQSGNDAANMAAVHIGGSIEGFTELMNQRAKQIGMENTHFSTPSGLDQDDHYSTAADMAKLAQEALKNADFLEICSSYKAKVEYGNPPYTRWMTNHNRLLKEYQGAIGVKTGFTKKSGRCLVSAAERDGIQLIAVTLKAPNDWQDHKQMLDYGFSVSQLVELPIPELSKATVVGGMSSCVELAAQPIQGNRTQEELALVESEIHLKQFYYAPITSGEVLGSIVYRLDGKQIGETPLTANGAVVQDTTPPDMSFWEKCKAQWQRFCNWVSALFG